MIRRGLLDGRVTDTNYWAFPYYVVGTVIALVIQYSVPLGLAVTLQQMPLVYLAHLFYSQYVARQQG